MHKAELPQTMEIAPIPETGHVNEHEKSHEIIKTELLDPNEIADTHDRENKDEVIKQIEILSIQKNDLERTIVESNISIHQLKEDVVALGLEKEQQLIAQEEETLRFSTKMKALFGMKNKAIDQYATIIAELEIAIKQKEQQLHEIRKMVLSLQGEKEALPNEIDLRSDYLETVASLPMSNAEKREYLTPEFLEQLSTKEYIALWKRMSPHFLSHVTRQGFRDHNAMIYHSGGMESFHNGLNNILDDEKSFRPPIAVRDKLMDRETESIEKFLHVHKILENGTKQEALDALDYALHRTMASAPKYADSTALHFAAEMVADDYYGGERNNEIFFIYPSDVIASQHDFAFNAWERDFTEKPSEDKWNDVFVYPKSIDNPRISINTGFTFLPKDTPVDPKTGSKYASELKIVDGKEVQTSVEDTERFTIILEWIQSFREDSKIVDLFKQFYYGQHHLYKQFHKTAKEEIQQLDCDFDEGSIDQLIHDIERALGSAFTFDNPTNFGNPEDSIQEAVKKNISTTLFWKRPENSIPSSQYWEEFFTKHPEKKPNHVIFYTGDPTTAIHKFLEKNNIKKNTDDATDPLLGFEDRLITNTATDPRANRGYDELVNTATELIERHYS